MKLTHAVDLVIRRHGGLNRAAEATGVDRGYLSRLRSGQKRAPSPETLERLGLERRSSYHLKRRGVA